MTVRRRRVLFAFLALVVLGAVILPAVAAACPNCKDMKSDSDYPGGSASLPSGFYYSVLLMASAPFAVAGTFVTRVVLARRKKRRQGLPPESRP